MARVAMTARAEYLDRLGVDIEPPSAEALFRLHTAHVERVPWETLWIHEGRRWTSAVDESVARIARTTRGGYCFHLNGAFGALLASLGYRVTRHVGGVHGPDGPAPADMTNHLVLMVGDLPTDANPRGRWYVDVGLGDALHEPLAMASGTTRQGPFDLRLDQVEGGLGDWHLTHDPSGSFTGMSWSATPTEMGVFAHRHEWLSTAPDSGFVQTLVVQRRDRAGADVLRGVTLQRVGSGASRTTLASSGEFFAALGDVFGIDVTSIDAPRRAALWDRVVATEAARRTDQETM